MVVFAIGIQNIHESYGEVKAYHGRIAEALSLQSKATGQHSTHGTPGDVVGDADTADDNPNAIEEVRRDMKRLFYLPGLDRTKNKSSIASKMDCNEFVVEALLQCNAIDYDTDLEPILQVSLTPYSIISCPTIYQLCLVITYCNVSGHVIAMLNYILSYFITSYHIALCHSI